LTCNVHAGILLRMQTFLPVPDWAESARYLDMRRLGKQRVECKQILHALGVPVGGALPARRGWQNHPATLMWRGHEYALCAYAIAICCEWRARGYKDSLLPQFQAAQALLSCSGPPPWLGDVEFHAAHRSNLLRKDPVYYAQFGWVEPDTLPYVWPRSAVVSS